MMLDVNDDYKKIVSAKSPEGLKVEAMLIELQKFFGKDDRVNEAVDEISTLWRLKGGISQAQVNFISKLYKRFC